MSDSHPLHAGFAKVDITPAEPLGMTLNGMPRPLPGARGVLDRLHARAMYLACGDEQFLLIACDTVAPRVMHPHHLDAAAALAEHGQIPPGNVWIVSTHTHSSIGEDGPAANAYQRKVLNRYLLDLEGKLVAVGRQAIDAAQPARLGHGCGPVEAVAASRRVKLSDGLVATGWGDGPSPPPGVRIVGRGPHDPDVNVMLFRDLRNRPLGAMINYNSHIHAYPALHFSAELAGATCRRLERRMPGLVGVFTVGALGDVALSENLEAQSSDPDAWAGQFKKMMKRMSAAMVDRIEQVCSQMRFTERGRMHSGDVGVTIRRRGRDDDAQRIRAVTVNDLALVSEVNELFVEYSLRLKEASPFRSTFVVGLHDIGYYLPTDMGIEEGGYEAKFWFEPGTFGRVLSASTRLLDRMHREVTP